MPTHRPHEAPPADDDMGRYLASLQLESLDLAGIEVEVRPPGSFGRIASALCLLLNTAGLCLLPGTALYQLHAVGGWLWAALALLEPGLLWAVVHLNWLRRQGPGRRANSAAAPNATSSSEPGAPGEPADAWLEEQDGEAALDKPLVALALTAAWQAIHARLAGGRRLWWRWLQPRQAQALRWAGQHRRLLLFAGIVATSLLLGFVLPQNAEWSGKTYSGLWFLAVLVALTTGILFGRFVIAAGDAAQGADSPPLAPIVLPPWLRWLSLMLLVGGGVAATFGPEMVSDHSPASGFPFAGLGFVVGIGGAIWLVRRFDEWEAQFARKAAQEAGRAALAKGPGDATKR